MTIDTVKDFGNKRQHLVVLISLLLLNPYKCPDTVRKLLGQSRT